MRGTLHFVAAEDNGRMLALLTPRIIARNARRYRELELNESIFTQASDLFITALQDGKRLTRAELMTVLAQAGISPEGQRGYHILGWLAQTGLICFGPKQGKTETFVLLDEWVPAERL